MTCPHPLGDVRQNPAYGPLYFFNASGLITGFNASGGQALCL
jgi:hypothetical protein